MSLYLSGSESYKELGISAEQWSTILLSARSECVT